MAVKKSKTNYSWKTSLPAYLENKMGKDVQEKLCLYVIKKLKGKKASIKEVQDYLFTRHRIRLPQSTVSGRFGDLRDSGKIAFYGEFTVYRGRLRKVFEVKNKRKKPVSLKKKNRKPAKKKIVKKRIVLKKNHAIKPHVRKTVKDIMRYVNKWIKIKQKK